jgi:hypothetical protein
LVGGFKNYLIFKDYTGLNANAEAGCWEQSNEHKKSTERGDTF